MKVNLAPGLINEGSNYTTRVAQRIDLDHAISFTTGITTDAALYSIQRDAAGTDHLQLNVPSGRGFKFSIAADEELIWATGAFAFQKSTTVSSTGTLTINAFTAGGAIDFGSQAMTSVDINSGTIGGVTADGDVTFTDNTKVTLGTGGDADIYYDATDMVINTRVAGSGDLVTHSQLVWGTGVAVTAADYSIGRDADGTNQLHFNVPSGAGYEFSVADGAKFIVKTNGALQVYGGGAVGDLDFAWTFDTNTGFYRSDPDRVNMVAGGVSVAGWSAMGLITGGTFNARSTTNPTRAISLFNGDAPVGTLSNGVTLYSASGELLVMDAAGNATTLS